MSEQWTPVEDAKHHVYGNITLHVSESGEWIHISGEHGVVPVLLPDHLRLCERVEDNRPRPDWSDAPEWAMWWAVDCDGKAWWYKSEPTYQMLGDRWSNSNYNAKGWLVPVEYALVNIPIGIDWRELVEKRPEASADE